MTDAMFHEPPPPWKKKNKRSRPCDAIVCVGPDPTEKENIKRIYQMR